MRISVSHDNLERSTIYKLSQLYFEPTTVSSPHGKIPKIRCSMCGKLLEVIYVDREEYYD